MAIFNSYVKLPEGNIPDGILTDTTRWHSCKANTPLSWSICEQIWKYPGTTSTTQPMLGEKYSIVPRYSFKMIMQNMQMANHVYITTIKECAIN